MTPTEHAQLYRELADELHQYDSANPYHDEAPLVARARQAADEIEGRRVPTDEEIIEFWNCHCVGDGDPGIIKLARFGGGEIEGQGEALEDAVHLLRFMCNTWHVVDRWAHANAGEAIMSYPVIQGTATQLALGRIGSQPYEQRRLTAALARFGGGEGQS